MSASVIHVLVMKINYLRYESICIMKIIRSMVHVWRNNFRDLPMNPKAHVNHVVFYLSLLAQRPELSCFLPLNICIFFQILLALFTPIYFVAFSCHLNIRAKRSCV